MLARYHMFAGYNAWCNERLYDAAAQVSEADYRANRGAFFDSLHGTLNHLLVGDRIWMHRFTGQGAVPSSLDAILFDDFTQLRSARRTEDERIRHYVGTLGEDDLAKTIRFRTVVTPPGHRANARPGARPFFQSPDASPWPGTCAAQCHHR
jgi:uncharacterized damage-inducible protein DinB